MEETVINTFTTKRKIVLEESEVEDVLSDYLNDKFPGAHFDSFEFRVSQNTFMDVTCLSEVSSEVVSSES